MSCNPITNQLAHELQDGIKEGNKSVGASPDIAYTGDEGVAWPGNGMAHPCDVTCYPGECVVNPNIR